MEGTTSRMEGTTSRMEETTNNMAGIINNMVITINNTAGTGTGMATPMSITVTMVEQLNRVLSSSLPVRRALINPTGLHRCVAV
jgi:hypothetical protein